MLWNIEDSNVNSLFYKALKDHKLHGVKQFIRGTTRHEITNYMMRLNDPKQNMLFIPFRYMNPPAIIAETLWVFSGRIDMWFLAYYLKNAKRYSDDGDVWRGCFTGDTKISLLNGKEIAIKKLVGKKIFYVYTFNPKTNKVTVGKGRNCRKTGTTNIIKITLDNKKEIKCTPDHKFLLLNGKYKRADKLTTKDCLMPLYKRYSLSKAYPGYEEIYQPIEEKWKLTHRLVGDWKYENGFVYHHNNCITTNNNPSNLKKFNTHVEHRIEHAKIGREIIAQKIKTDKVFRLKMRQTSRKNIKKATKSFLNKFYNDPTYRKWAQNYRRENIKKIDFKKVGKLNSERDKINREKLFKEYSNSIKECVNKRMTIKEISLKLGLNYRTISQIRRDLGFFGKTAKWHKQHKNHKIIKIKIGNIEDVYDIEVEGTNNFALSAGVFVHNSYGKRLINYSGRDDEGRTIIIDQIDRAITYLKKDLQTTRSLLVIPDSSDYHLDEDGNEKKDEPCTVFVQFIHREGGLCCSVNMRSNDLVLGCFNVNVFEWTFLQTLIANELFSSMGHYTVSATSMHVYTDWMKRLPILLDNEPAVDIYSIVPAKQLTVTWSTFKHEVQRLLQVEQNLRITHASRISDYVLDLQDEFHEDIYDALLVMMITLATKQGAHGSLCELLPEMRNDIWLVACLEYMVRRFGNSFHSLVHKIFNETLGERYDQMTVKYLHDYIMHSIGEQAAIDRLK